MTSLKTLTIATALIVGASTLAFAQNGQPTGGYPPVGGGAAASNPSGGGGAKGSPTMGKTTHHKSMKKKMSKPQ